MNIRQLYIAFIFVFALALFYQYSSEQRVISADREVELMKVEAAKQLDLNGGDFVYLENDLLRLVIKTSDGSIVEARSKEHLVQKVEGSLGVRIFGSDALSGFKYYFKSGFTGSQKNYSFQNYINNGVLLVSDDGLATKEIVFSDLPYEVLITDSSPNGVEGKPYASLYRSDAQSLDMNFDFASGGMINRSSYEAYVISTSQDPYEAERLRKVEAPVSVTSGGGWVGFTQKYFLAALLGSNDFIYNYHVDGNNKGGLYKMGYVVQPDDFSSKALTGHTHTLFVGPKIRKNLVVRANNLEQTIEMGWFWFI